ncbi:hypothetical protein [Brevibacillus halotolerans]|uniref:hypothetical protein n=1 Tax=Brevibacillus halotolerans TaxID=1507437 RepID=UPI0015EFD5AC|nr:hypothetical protein [Brevibacillus halotolerans]MBA4535218.1 hypothetical protein [Brevibacillus halotolerans]
MTARFTTFIQFHIIIVKIPLTAISLEVEFVTETENIFVKVIKGGNVEMGRYIEKVIAHK